MAAFLPNCLFIVAFLNVVEKQKEATMATSYRLVVCECCVSQRQNLFINLLSCLSVSGCHTGVCG